MSWGGLAEAAAGALAMGTGAYLASRAENQLFANEIAAEEQEYADHPGVSGPSSRFYALTAVIPLWPYLMWSVGTALVVSLVATGLALFALGLVKGRVAGMALVRSGLQVLLVGAAPPRSAT